MRSEEANKIIAEFIGLCVYMGKRGQHKVVTSIKNGRVNCATVSDLYSESIDALVPVWEKLEMIPELTMNKNGYHAWFNIDQPYPDQYCKIEHEGSGNTIQEAAAIATAMAIRARSE